MALSAKDKQGYMIIAGVGAALIGLVVVSQSFKAPARDKLGCTSAAPVSNTVILLDHSEGISDQTRREIENRVIDFISEQVMTDEKVSMYAVSDKSSKALTPLFEGCKLPSSGNVLYENDKTIRWRFEKNFMEKLRTALRQRYADSDNSPIAQAVSDLSVSKDLQAPRSNLLIFSDMIENSPSLDMYTCPAEADPRKLYRSANAGAVERPTFKNVAVSINFIPRRGIEQSTLRCRRLFWPWFFGDNSGDRASVNDQYLPG